MVLRLLSLLLLAALVVAILWLLGAALTDTFRAITNFLDILTTGRALT
jgi:Flp pilus assembly pilin Flp